MFNVVKYFTQRSIFLYDHLSINSFIQWSDANLSVCEELRDTVYDLDFFSKEMGYSGFYITFDNDPHSVPHSCTRSLYDVGDEYYGSVFLDILDDEVECSDDEFDVYNCDNF
jgi:hypothetical protein